MTKLSIGITRDFLDTDGCLRYRDIGLGLLDADPRAEYRYFPEHVSPVPPAQAAGWDAVLTLTPHWTRETFRDGAERLLVVARFGVGYDECDVPTLTDNDVLLTIARGAPDHPVAGGVVALMLALSRRLFLKDRLVREGRWQERGLYQGTEMGGKVLGMVGYGGNARRLRRLLEPWEMTLLAYDPYASADQMAADGVERVTDLGELFERSDYVSVHCPLTQETRGLIGRDLFRRMKPTAFFINAARGPIVREAELVEALRERRIAGAGIDVFEQEPPAPDNPLFHLDNVILTPHAVCWTDECFQAIGETAIRSILTAADGELPPQAVNPEVWERPGFQRKLQALRERLRG